jgi:hypothetical protein
MSVAGRARSSILPVGPSFPNPSPLCPIVGTHVPLTLCNAATTVQPLASEV